MKNDDWTQPINIIYSYKYMYLERKRFDIAALTIMKLKYELDVRFVDLFKILKYIYLLFFSNI